MQENENNLSPTENENTKENETPSFTPETETNEETTLNQEVTENAESETFENAEGKLPESEKTEEIPFQAQYQPPQYSAPFYPYPPYPYYPPIKVKKLLSAVKVFVIILAVLYGISSFGLVFGIAYSVIKSNSQTAYNDYQNYLDKYKEFEDYYGQFDEFFGDDYENPYYGYQQPEEDKPEKGETEEYVQPDIKYSPNTDGIKINQKPKGEPLSAEEAYNKVIVSTVSVNVKVPLADGTYEDSSGSGIIITEDGFIITNSHVISNTKSSIVKVVTYDGTEHPAIIAAFDKATDLAVLKIDAEGLTPAEFGNDEEMHIGEWVIAIGSPGGQSFSGSLTRGVISGLNRVIDTTETSNITYIQTDAVINPGNSGGPLANMYGQVIGINTSKIAAEAYEGMGFSIPVTDAKDILDQLLASGYVEGRVRVGITGQNNVQGNPYGVIIVEIDPTGSSFDGTLAKVNDIIVAMDGKKIQSLSDLTTALQKYKAGDKAEVTLYRPATGRELTVDIILLPDEGETQR